MALDTEVVAEDPEMAWEVSWRNAVAAEASADLDDQVELGQQATLLSSSANSGLRSCSA